MITAWEQVSLEQYTEICAVLLDEDESVESIIVLLSILLDISEDEVEAMEYSVLQDLESQIGFLAEGVTRSDVFPIISDKEFRPISFKYLEFGAFIDIEHLVGTDYVNNLHKIFSILFRQIDKEETDLTEATYETYTGWTDKRANLFYSLPITQLHHVLVEYMTFRKNIFNNYEGLFSSTDEDYDDDEEDLSGLTSKERDEINQEKRASKWGWELLIHKLAGKNALQMDKATSIPVIQALNILSMYHEMKIG